VLHQRNSKDAGRHKVRRDLMVMQVVGSLTLLIIAALFTRSLENTERARLASLIPIRQRKGAPRYANTAQIRQPCAVVYLSQNDRLYRLPLFCVIGEIPSSSFGIERYAMPDNHEARPEPQLPTPKRVLPVAVEPFTQTARRFC
jgi:hypothetical protein